MYCHESSIRPCVPIPCAGVFRHRAEVSSLRLLTKRWKMNLFGIYFVARIDTDPYAVYTSLWYDFERYKCIDRVVYIYIFHFSMISNFYGAIIKYIINWWKCNVFLFVTYRVCVIFIRYLRIIFLVWKSFTMVQESFYLKLNFQLFS